jgi:uncharacterized membrane protein (UPF0127 family)
MRWLLFKHSPVEGESKPQRGFGGGYQAASIAMACAIAFSAHALTFPESPYCLTTGKTAQTLRLQIAETPETLMHGLMFREEIKPYDGMFFNFGAPQKIRMWMKNTPHPLDMLFIDAAGKIVHTVENTVPYSEAIIEGPDNVGAVIELEAGRAKQEGFDVGTRVAKGRCP